MNAIDRYINLLLRVNLVVIPILMGERWIFLATISMLLSITGSSRRLLGVWLRSVAQFGRILSQFPTMLPSHLCNISHVTIILVITTNNSSNVTARRYRKVDTAHRITF